jgi:hypothetical protein
MFKYLKIRRSTRPTVLPWTAATERAIDQAIALVTR